MATASAYTDVAQELYVSYFGRPADTNGLLAMTAALAAAGAPTDTAGLDAAYQTSPAVRSLLNSFGTSAESTVLYGTTTPGLNTVSFVSQIFTNLFGRAPKAEGLAFWTQAIESGALTQAGAAHAILTGAVKANNADAALVAKKVAFANKFTSAMDTVTEIDVYRGNMAAQFGRDLLSRVTASTDPSTTQSAVEAVLARLGAAVILTAGADKAAAGSDGALFLADLAGAGNALQSGDTVVGGAGTDTLRAVLGAAATQIPTPATASVENVLVQAVGGVEPAGRSVLDAKNMGGVTRWESDHSRGDLIINNVGILSGQLPEDVTVAMVGGAPGNADFGVYFAPSALRASNPQTGATTLRLQLMDTRANDAGEAPLKDNIYDGFRFLLNKMPVLVRSPAIVQAQTYEELLVAIKAQVAATPGLEKLVVSLGQPFQVYDTQSGQLQTGREILITNTGPGALGVAPGAGWVTPGAYADAGIVPGTYAGAAPLITGSILLDNVGRGGVGGDLVVGGTPLSDTNSVRAGFEAFNITVERNSMLQTINSTDNTLQVVNLANGTAGGDLSLRGAVQAITTDTPLEGTGGYASAGGVKPYGMQAGDDYGLHDVRQINASAMTGKVDLTAVISAAALQKYLGAPGSRTGSATESVDFHTIGGNNADSLSVAIAPDMAGSRGVRLTGHEDFRFFISGGGGDDLLQAHVLRPSLPGNAWAIDQDLNNNLTLSGGSGNDTIRKTGEGDAIIDGGSGNDTIFGDTSGGQPVLLPLMPSTVSMSVKGQWVFNTRDQSGPLAAARLVGQLDSDAADTYTLSGARVDVSFRGIDSKVSVATTLLTPTSSDREINAAIKHAINDDAVLGKLLLATDGPGNTLMVDALIDGAMAAGDLRVSLHAVDGANRSGIDAFNAKGDYVSALAVNKDRALFPVNSNGQSMQAVTGDQGYHASDNQITPGTGDDLMVLGTAEKTSTATSSNDTLIFGAGFGNDSVLNFDMSGPGIDHLDLSALGGLVLTTSLTLDKSIGIAAASAANDSAAKVGALFSADNAAAQTHVYAVVDASGNAAAIYAVSDAAGAGNAVATLAGNIHMGPGVWLGGLTAANFVNAASAGYSSAEGASGLLSVPVALVGVAPESTLAGLADGAA